MRIVSKNNKNSQGHFRLLAGNILIGIINIFFMDDILVEKQGITVWSRLTGVYPLGGLC